MDNINIDKDMLNNLKSMMGEDKVNDALSQLSPEMIENFSKMMNSNNKSSNNNDNTNTNDMNFGDLDMATIMRIKAAFDSMNNSKNDPRNNLLNSLKPYMRDSRKDNIDKYSNFLKMAKVMKLFNKDVNDGM